jgi:hypothetical protein
MVLPAWVAFLHVVERFTGCDDGDDSATLSSDLSELEDAIRGLDVRLGPLAVHYFHGSCIDPPTLHDPPRWAMAMEISL